MINTLDKYGKWALITGASSGIGEEFARELAKRGHNLVLLARREDKLKILKKELENHSGIEVRLIFADLAKNDFMEKVLAVTADITISILINNAGYGSTGSFAENDLNFQADMVRVNCYAPVLLTHHFVNKMKTEGKGAVIFLGSVVAYQPVPMMSVYSATKVFNLLLGESLWYELKGSNIDVLVVNPGATKTEFQRIANIDTGPTVRTVEQVVKSTFSALGKKPSVIDGILNKITAISGRFMPRKILISISGKIATSLYKKFN